MEHEVVGKLRARVAAWRHGNPSRTLKIIAVAGAHGKTTTTLLLGEMLQEAGHSVMTLTGHGCLHNGQLISRRYDTSADTLQHCLATAKKKDVGYVIVEVTDALVATHVLPTLLITMSVVTSDSTAARSLLEQPVDYTVVPSGFDVVGLSVEPHQAISFGEDGTSEAQIAKVTERRKGTEIDLVIDHQTKLSVATYLVGKANVLNVAAAISAAYVLAADTNAFEEGIARLELVRGNFEYLQAGDVPYLVAVDGAASERSVELVLGSANAFKKRRLLVVADASVPTETYPTIKRLSDRAAVVGTAPELPGLEQASSMQAALDLITRAAKKDDLVLLIGREFAALGADDLTAAHHMFEAKSE
jgi:UDP-N-acetylmuramoyl-L-alanyl-D-glutamate--2,6-diaminopimelate ligase